MNPRQFNSEVLPQLEGQWSVKCFCDNKVYQKLISFNFADFGVVAPVGLADSEILIHSFVRDKFEALSEGPAPSGVIQEWKCPQCGRICKLHDDEYSISMRRSYVTYAQAGIAEQAYYLIGFFGIDVGPSTHFSGYEEAVSIEAYLAQFIAV